MILVGLGWAASPAGMAAEGPGRPLVVGSEPDFPPLALGQTEASAGGFTVELWKAVAREQRLNFTLRVRPFAQLLQEFKRGEIDVLINLAQSDARREFADFTVPHVVIHGAVFVRRGEGRIQTEADLAGKELIVINADLAHDYAAGRGWQRQLVPVATAEEGLRLLAEGKHDAMLMSKLVGLHTLAKAGIQGIQALPIQAGFNQKFAFAVRKGEAALLAQLNEGLAVSKSNGRYDALYEQWLGVYDPKALAVADVLKFALPLLAGLIAWQAYFLHRSRLNRQRREAALELQRSQEHLQAIVNSVEGIVWEADAATFRFTFVSPQAERLLGYPVTQWVVEPHFWTNHLHPDDREEALRYCIKCTRAHRNHEFEYRMIAADGRTVWLRDLVTVVVEDGRLVKLRGILVDITARIHAEQRLRQLSSAVEQTDDSVLITNREGVIEYVNAGFEKTTGYASTEVLGQTPRLLKAEGQPRAFFERLWQTITAGQPFRAEFVNRRKAGSTYHEEKVITPLRNLQGEITHYVSVGRDISQRKAVEAALEESRQMLERAQQVGHIGSWVSAPGSQGTLTWSAEASRIFGFAPGEFDGRVETFFALVHPEDRDAVARASRAALAGKRAYDLEHRIVRRDGQVRWVHEQADVERDSAGQPVRMVGVVQDVTEHRRLEEQLHHSQRLEAMGQLAGGIAHDFNNLLSAILGNVELAQLQPPGSPESRTSLAEILTASRRARDLVQQILAFSRRQVQRREPMQLHTVVREALSLMRASVPAAIEFKARIAITPTVLANASEIHQVTVNLCTNAWHALKGHPGLIEVELAETEVTPDFARKHRELRPGRYVCLIVADNGCGMDETTLERIFEPFFTTKPVGEGTGLGLAVVHGIVKSHDGGIAVSSEPGKGTAFALYFPVFVTEVVEPPAAAQPVPRGRGEHILLVDDEEPLTRMGRSALELLGYRVTTATRPGEALALFHANPAQYDLVITDLNMPALDGTELARKLVAARPEVRLMLITGYSAAITAEMARDLGFRELLSKPYDLRSLGDAIHRTLNETTFIHRS